MNNLAICFMATSTRNWIEHALRRSRFQPEQQVVALATLGFVIALILGALYLSQVATEASTHTELRAMMAERDELERVNDELRAEIAELKSVPRLEARALELGFVTAGSGNIEWLAVDGYAPIQPETVAPVENVSEAELAAPYDQTFADWLAEQWERLREGIGG